MLKYHGHAQGARFAGVVDAHRPAIDLDTAGVHLHAAVNDLHQRGLAGTVFAQHRMDFARQQGQRHPIIGHRAGIGFGDTGELEAGNVHQGGK